MRKPRVLGIIMAGGQGERLFPLTKERSKPSVPFGGKYRIVDFVLNNFINSDIHSIYVLVQYKSQSLIEHLRSAWSLGRFLLDHFITVVPPQMLHADIWYRGTADAVYQNLNLIEDFCPDLVAVFGADHIYRMDIRQMIRFHLDKEAEVTVAARPVPIGQAASFGIIGINTDQRVVDFQEKPERPKPLPQDPSLAFSSMGNYIFNREVLARTLKEDAHRSTEHDFGRTILPQLLSKAQVFAYNFLQNEMPGCKEYEEKGYWRDVGTIETYWEAHMDLLGPRPWFDLNNLQWPLMTMEFAGPPAKITRGEVEDSILGEGCFIRGGKVSRSVLGRGVVVEEDSLIEDSIVMDFCQISKGARVRKTVIDRYNIIEGQDQIGYEPERDKERFFLDPSGIVVIPRGKTRQL